MNVNIVSSVPRIEQPSSVSSFSNNVQLFHQSPRTSSGQFEFKEITSIEVLTALRKLPSGKKCGLDELLKLGDCSTVCSSLATLFNMSLSQGSFPAVWNSATVTAILKAGKNAYPGPIDHGQLLVLAAFQKPWNDSYTSSCFA